MPKKKIQETDSGINIDDIDISSTVGVETHSAKSIKGMSITLNQKVDSFFGVANIWLTPNNYTCVVPDTITNTEEAIIKNALKRGIIVEGDHVIPPLDKDEAVLEEYWHLVKTYGLNMTDDKAPSTVKFRALFKKGVDRNWTAKEVAKFCIKNETNYKRRDKVLKILNDLHTYSDCPETLYEPTN